MLFLNFNTGGFGLEYIALLGLKSNRVPVSALVLLIYLGLYNTLSLVTLPPTIRIGETDCLFPELELYHFSTLLSNLLYNFSLRVRVTSCKSDAKD